MGDMPSADRRPSRRPAATLSIDVDNTWAYRRAAGHDDWAQSDSILPLAIDRMVDLLGELQLPLTAFLVGRDLDCDADVDAIGQITRLDDWEFANHSWNHLPWLHTLPPDEVAAEIDRTSAAIADRFGASPVGFRGPGFSCPPPVRDLLIQRGYWYDASVFPTSLAPIARAVFLAKSNLRGEEREKAKQLYGGWSSMRQPNRPHAETQDRTETSNRTQQRGGDDRSLWRIPVTTMPVLRTPIHFSYVTFLASYNVTVAKVYVRTAFAMCKQFDVVPSLLLHPPDFLGGDDTEALSGFPGMSLSSSDKLELTRWILQRFADTFDVTTLADSVPKSHRPPSGTDAELLTPQKRDSGNTAATGELDLATVVTGGS